MTDMRTYLRARLNKLGYCAKSKFDEFTAPFSESITVLRAAGHDVSRLVASLSALEAAFGCLLRERSMAVAAFAEAEGSLKTEEVSTEAKSVQEPDLQAMLDQNAQLLHQIFFKSASTEQPTDQMNLFQPNTVVLQLRAEIDAQRAEIASLRAELERSSAQANPKHDQPPADPEQPL